MKKYFVYYQKQMFRKVSPDPSNVTATHVFIGTQFASGEQALESVFLRMQGEEWSPNGEAINLIKAVGADHTSMSVGDVIVDEDGNVFGVENIGFKLIS
jgi:hypothetical protein